MEVKNKNGEFVAARPIKGTVLVNIADLLQRWTADKLKSTVRKLNQLDSHFHCPCPPPSPRDPPVPTGFPPVPPSPENHVGSVRTISK